MREIFYKIAEGLFHDRQDLLYCSAEHLCTGGTPGTVEIL